MPYRRWHPINLEVCLNKITSQTNMRLLSTILIAGSIWIWIDMNSYSFDPRGCCEINAKVARKVGGKFKNGGRLGRVQKWRESSKWRDAQVSNSVDNTHAAYDGQKSIMTLIYLVWLSLQCQARHTTTITTLTARPCDARHRYRRRRLPISMFPACCCCYCFTKKSLTVSNIVSQQITTNET